MWISLLHLSQWIDYSIDKVDTVDSLSTSFMGMAVLQLYMCAFVQTHQI